jgi:hypothetical protein
LSGKPHGFGAYFWKNTGDTLFGKWVSDSIEGPGVIYTRNGEIKLSGYWERNKFVRRATVDPKGFPFEFPIEVTATGGPLPLPKEIENAVGAGDYSHAEKLLGIVIKEKPKSAKAHHQLGQVLLALGRRAEGQDEFCRAAAIEPNLSFTSKPDFYVDLLPRCMGFASQGESKSGSAIASLCPTQIPPEMPRRSLREGIGGVVRAKITITGEGIKSVEIISGPTIFHEAVINAVKAYKCNVSERIVATQEFVFSINGFGALELQEGSVYVGDYITVDKSIPDGKGIEYTRDGLKIRSGLWKKGRFETAIEFPSDQPYLFSKADALEAVKRHKQEISERLRTAELEADRKRREDAEEKLRIAQQQQINPPPLPSASGKRVALIIGNSNYKAFPLDNPVNDAKDVAAALRGSGFETQEVLNATKLQMLEATRAFERKVVNSDVALIYYAGHGTEVKGKNYMIPVGANIEREYELSEQAYDAAQWLDMLEGAKGTNTKRVNIVILDACRNNSLTRGWRSSNAGLARMDVPVGTFLAYSTAPGKVASDGNGRERNSPFAKHLVNAIKQPNMPIEQVFKRVRSAVIDETKGDQTPWDSSSLVGDFFFTVKK